jgi:hypothetical protein
MTMQMGKRRRSHGGSFRGREKRELATEVTEITEKKMQNAKSQKAK